MSRMIMLLSASAKPTIYSAPGASSAVSETGCSQTKDLRPEHPRSENKMHNLVFEDTLQEQPSVINLTWNVTRQIQ